MQVSNDSIQLLQDQFMDKIEEREQSLLAQLKAIGIDPTKPQTDLKSEEDIEKIISIKSKESMPIEDITHP